jgi:hypothetical protein
MRKHVAAKKKAIKHVEKANKLAKGKQPIMTRDPALQVQDVEAAKTRAAGGNRGNTNADQWAS